MQNHAIANKVLDAETDCVICSKKLLKAAALGDETTNIEVIVENKDCGHAFHRTCLAGWINNNGRFCPICRSAIPQRVLNRLSDDKDIKENQVQQLGLNDPDLASWYADEGAPARATNGLQGSTPQYRESLQILREELNDRLHEVVGDTEDVVVLHQLLTDLEDNHSILLDNEYAPHFDRWVSYAIRNVRRTPPYCDDMIDILKLIRPKYDSTNFANYVKLAVRCTNDERDPSFPSCTNQIIDYLEETDATELAELVERLVATEQARRLIYRDSPSPRACLLM